jgi:hypothetical protein
MAPIADISVVSVQLDELEDPALVNLLDLEPVEEFINPLVLEPFEEEAIRLFKLTITTEETLLEVIDRTITFLKTSVRRDTNYWKRFFRLYAPCMHYLNFIAGNMTTNTEFFELNYELFGDDLMVSLSIIIENTHDLRQFLLDSLSITYDLLILTLLH